MLTSTRSWTLNKDIAKRLAAFEKKVFRRIVGGIKVSEKWRKQYNTELMQLFGDTLSLVGGSQLKKIDLVNRMESKRKVSQAFNNNLQGS